MELWRVESDRAKRPNVLDARHLALAFALHFGCFVLFWLYSVCHGLFTKSEEIVPIDLTVVVNENLDGKEDEPPPVKNPEPEKPKPKPEPPKPKPAVKEPEKPKELEKIVTNIVAKVEKKPEKKKEPEKPKKTKEELLKERMEKMRQSAKVSNKKVKIEVKNAKESGNGRTEKQTMTPDQIRALLNQGYRPGTKTQLATSVKQRCLMLIQRALDEKWDALSPSVGQSGTVLLSVQFSSTGGMINVRLTKSCGDGVSDAAALSVAKSVSFIQGLDPEFIAEFRKEPLTIRYKVQGK